jgi:DNA-binding transcriptional MerR regulator
LSEKEKEALLPPESRNEARPVRDYQVLFRAENVRRALLTDQIDATARDLKLVKEALDQAQEQEKAAQQDVAAAKEDAKATVGQRDAVAAYLKTLQHDLDTAKADVDQLLKNNQNMAEQMAKLQGEAARRIDQRTRAMAQSGAGGT